MNKFFQQETYRQIIKFDDRLGHIFIPNLNVRINNNDYAYYIKTNSYGFRSNIEFNNKKKKKRILFFGDSNTAGDGIPNEKRYTDLLGEFFNAEVFNYAVSGYGTDQQYLTWKQYAKKIQADLIVIGSLVENIERNKVAFRETKSFFSKNKTLTAKPYFELKNDTLFLANYPVKKFDGNIKKIDKKKVQWSIPLEQKNLYKIINLLRSSSLYNFINNFFEKELLIIRSFLIKLFYQPYVDYKKFNSKGCQLLKKILDQFLSDIRKENDTPIILMPIPTFHYYFDNAKPIYQNFYKQFSDYKNKIYVSDPLEYLKNLDFNKRKDLSLLNDKAHFSLNGHRELANFLKKEIIDLKIFNLSKKLLKKKYLNRVNKNKPTYILGISAFYHDSAATLLKDDNIVAAAQEERFTRIKNDKSFPTHAINYCLEQAKINSEDLKTVIFYDNTYSTFERTLWSFLKTDSFSKDSWNKYIPRWITYKLFIPSIIRKKLNYKGKVLHNQHHRSHLASAFYPSPFNKSAILTIDGVGEWATASIGVGNRNKIKMLKEMNYPNSVGLLYSAFTEFLGFKVNSGEYKVMGLAPYGKPIYYNLIFQKLVHLNEDGSIKINQDYFSYLEGIKMTNQKFANLFGGSPRVPDSIITKREMNIASSIQKVTEKIVFTMAAHAKKITKSENLCMSGGVALNCVINGHLMKSNLFKNIWIQPASGDAGSSLGCAYDAYYSYFNKKRFLKKKGEIPFQKASLFGPSWSRIEIKSFLDSSDIKYKFFKDKSVRNKFIANYLNQGKVIGLFLGRSEFGPRALGARSIIGDPRDKKMQSKMNLKIKFRESFRPFAPAILKEKTHNYFELKKESPYMMMVTSVKKNKRNLEIKIKENKDLIRILKEQRSDIPAVTHVDYSARVQTVDKGLNNEFYQIIKEFEKKTGCPLVINTSFNVRGEPIVNSPLDSYNCFLKTDMDILVIEDFIIKKLKKNNKAKRKENENKITKNNLFKSFSDNKDIKRIFFETKKININDTNLLDGWVYSSPFNKKNIFEIPSAIDRENYNSYNFTKNIIKFWKNKKFGKDMFWIVFNLIKISKKNKLKNEEFDNKVSDNIYEMF